MAWLKPLLRWLKDWCGEDPEPISGLYATDMPCDLCDRVKPTTVEGVQVKGTESLAIYRLCESCKRGLTGS